MAKQAGVLALVGLLGPEGAASFASTRGVSVAKGEQAHENAGRATYSVATPAAAGPGSNGPVKSSAKHKAKAAAEAPRLPYRAGREASKNVQAVILTAQQPLNALLPVLRRPLACNHVNVSTALMCVARLAGRAAPPGSLHGNAAGRSSNGGGASNDDAAGATSLPSHAEAEALHAVLQVAADLATAGHFGARHAANVAWAVARLSTLGWVEAPSSAAASSSSEQPPAAAAPAATAGKTAGKEATAVKVLTHVRLAASSASTAKGRRSSRTPASAAEAASAGAAAAPSAATAARTAASAAGVAPAAGTAGAAAAAAAAASTAATGGAPPELMDRLLPALAASFARHARDCKPTEAAMVAWAFATLGRADAAVLLPVAGLVEERAASFPPRELATLLWAFATADYYHQGLMSAIADVVAGPRPEQGEPGSSATGDHAERKPGKTARIPNPATAASPSPSAAATASVTATAITAAVTAAPTDPTAVAALATAAAAAVAAPMAAPAIPTAAAAAIAVAWQGAAVIGATAAAGALKPQDLSMLAWGFSALCCRHWQAQGCAERVMAAVAAAALPRLAEFNRQDLAQLALAMARMGWDDEPLLEGIAARAAAQADAMPLREISNMAWAFARLNFAHQGFLAAMARRAIRLASAASAAPAAAGATAPAVAHSIDCGGGGGGGGGRSSSSGNDGRHCGVVSAGLSEGGGSGSRGGSGGHSSNGGGATCKTQELSNLAWAAAVLDFPAPELLRVVFRELEAMGGCSDEELRQLYQVWVVSRRESKEAFEGVSKAFLAEMSRCWRKEKRRRKESSERHLSVSHILKLMHIEHTVESEHDIDIAIVGHGLLDPTNSVAAVAIAAAAAVHRADNGGGGHGSSGGAVVAAGYVVAGPMAMAALPGNGAGDTAATATTATGASSSPCSGAAALKPAAGAVGAAAEKAASSDAAAAGAGGPMSGTVRVRMAVEVDGPAHFTRNTRRILGHTVLKHRMLREMGWTVVQVPFHEYDPIPFWASMEKKRYLQRRLGIQRTMFFGSHDWSTYAPIAEKRSRFD